MTKVPKNVQTFNVKGRKGYTISIRNCNAYKHQQSLPPVNPKEGSKYTVRITVGKYC